MWSGWLAGVSLWALITTAFVAERTSDDSGACGGWFGVAIPTYVLVVAMAAFTLWPCIRYRNAWMPKTSGRVLDSANRDADAMMRRIDDDKRHLRADATMIAFSVVLEALLLASAIVLPYELDQHCNGAPAHFNGGIGLLIAMAVIVTAVYAIVMILRAARSVRAQTTLREQPRTAPPFATLFACCHPEEHDDYTAERLESTRERGPACFGDYPLDSWATVVYNAMLFVAGVLVIIALAVLLALVNGAPDGAHVVHHLSDVFVYAWVAMVLVAATTTTLLVVTFRDGTTPFYDAMVALISLVVLVLVFIFSLVALHADTVAPHIVATPLYVAFGTTTLVFALGEYCHCQSHAYRVVMDHGDAAHFAHRPDGLAVVAAPPPPTNAGVRVAWDALDDRE